MQQKERKTRGKVGLKKWPSMFYSKSQNFRKSLAGLAARAGIEREGFIHLQ
jgi:hypothetical protein